MGPIPTLGSMSNIEKFIIHKDEPRPGIKIQLGEKCASLLEQSDFTIPRSLNFFKKIIDTGINNLHQSKLPRTSYKSNNLTKNIAVDTLDKQTSLNEEQFFRRIISLVRADTVNLSLDNSTINDSFKETISQLWEDYQHLPSSWKQQKIILADIYHKWEQNPTMLSWYVISDNETKAREEKNGRFRGTILPYELPVFNKAISFFIDNDNQSTPITRLIMNYSAEKYHQKSGIKMEDLLTRIYDITSVRVSDKAVADYLTILQMDF